MKAVINIITLSMLVIVTIAYNHKEQENFQANLHDDNHYQALSSSYDDYHGSAVHEEEGKGRAPDEVDDPVIVDGDIALSQEQAAIYYKDGWNGLVNSEAWSPSTRRWGRKIPYKLSWFLNGEIRTNTIKSINEINKRTCVTLYKKRFWEFKQFILFKPSSKGCYTYLGRPPFGFRTIYLHSGCAGIPSRAMTPAHELMHAMGRYHEQTRPDRDKYVVINENKCPDQMEKVDNAMTFGISYDYYSVMHYSRWQCALSATEPSMTFPPEINPNKVGQRFMLSPKDVAHINQVHCPEMMMRLVDGKGSFEGRVQVSSNGAWGNICSDEFDEKDARVICKYLGHPGLDRLLDKPPTKSRAFMSRLRCTGEENNPFDCEQATLPATGVHECTSQRDVAISCSKAARLVGSDNSGRLEVYHEGQWGSVCSDKFGRTEAKVACRMMGYSNAVRLFKRRRFGDHSSKIVLTRVKCNGSEAHLSSCDYDTEGCFKGKVVYLQCAKN